MKKHERESTQPPAGAIDELTLQNAIRKKYKQNWPAVIVEMMKRVQAVNSQWTAIMNKILFTEGLSVTYKREADNLVITVQHHDEQELHKISLEEVQKAMPYIEVMIMDRLTNSQLIAKVS